MDAITYTRPVTIRAQMDQIEEHVVATNVIDQLDLVGGPFAVIESDPGLRFYTILVSDC